MFKKYMAMFMACVLTLALSVPIVAYASGASSTQGIAASADEITSSDGKSQDTITMRYASVTHLPVLQLTIQNKAGLILNPYKLKYDESGGRANFDGSTDFVFDSYTASSEGSAQSTTGETYRQIICSPMVIASTTEVPVKVGVSVATTVTSGVTLSATEIATSGKGAVTTKSVYMYLAAAASDKTTGLGQNSTTGYNDVITAALAKKHTTTSKGTLVLTTAKAAENADFITIPAQNDDDEADAQYAAFVFSGNMVVSPKKTVNKVLVDDPWTTSDKVSPTITLTLTVQENDYSSEIAAAAANGT